MPAKPKISIAQVAGSGTAPATVSVRKLVIAPAVDSVPVVAAPLDHENWHASGTLGSAVRSVAGQKATPARQFGMSVPLLRTDSPPS